MFSWCRSTSFCQRSCSLYFPSKALIKTQKTHIGLHLPILSHRGATGLAIPLSISCRVCRKFPFCIAMQRALRCIASRLQCHSDKITNIRTPGLHWNNRFPHWAPLRLYVIGPALKAREYQSLTQQGFVSNQLEQNSHIYYGRTMSIKPMYSLNRMY